KTKAVSAERRRQAIAIEIPRILTRRTCAMPIRTEWPPENRKSRAEQTIYHSPGALAFDNSDRPAGPGRPGEAQASRNRPAENHPAPLLGGRIKAPPITSVPSRD